MKLKYKHSFKNGVNISKERVEKYKREVYKRVKKSKDFDLTATGNTIVLGWWNPEQKEVNIIVCKKYKEYLYK